MHACIVIKVRKNLYGDSVNVNMFSLLMILTRGNTIKRSVISSVMSRIAYKLMLLLLYTWALKETHDSLY